MHPYALPAAVATRCAGEQGKFWQYRDAFFADQSQIVSSPGFDVRALLPRDADPFDKLARNLHMDVARFDACRRDVRQDAVVREDIAMARRDGITGTPSFMIGRVVDGELRGRDDVRRQVLRGVRGEDRRPAARGPLSRAQNMPLGPGSVGPPWLRDSMKSPVIISS